MNEQDPPFTERIDKPLLALYATLVVAGLAMILSASHLEADTKYGAPYRFLVRQMLGVGLGITAGVGILFIPMRLLRRLIWPVYGLATASLLMVLTPLAHTANGATRWFRLGPVNVQPSEFMKIALVLGLAHYLSINEGRLRDNAVVAMALALLGLPLLFMLPQKDLGTMVILSGLAGVLLFVAGLPWRYLFGLLGTGLIGLVGLIVSEPYRLVRLMSFTDPFLDQSGAGYQVVQGWIALATGGFFGQGLGNGVAQRGFLPEAHTDFISAVVGEELGALGWSVMVCLFLAVVWRAMVIASRARDSFGMLAATGLGTLLGAQCIINLGVVGGVVPNKGLVLPFLSYGASAAVAHALVIALLLRIGMESNPPGTRGTTPVGSAAADLPPRPSRA